MKVYLLEDDPERIRKFTFWLIGHEWDAAQTCGRHSEFKPNFYDVLFLDHDLGGRQMSKGGNLTLPKEDLEGKFHELIYRNGYGLIEDCGLSFTKLIKGRIAPSTNIIIHSHNPPASWAMAREFHDQGHHAHVYPFGSRDFIKIIEALQTEQSKKIMEVV